MSFKNILDTLKLSSKAAIAQGEKGSFNELNQYLHIERQVEKDLCDLVQKAYQSDLPQLILLSGNVGDGKSHLLARLWEEIPEKMESFHIHNDATESTSIHKTYIETLEAVLAPYNDEQLQDADNGEKTIIAINLGTLTNFLDDKGKDFQQLKAYVEDFGILKDEPEELPSKEEKFFQFINLADYHIFSLDENGPDSQVLLDIINKVTLRQEQNPFFAAYQNYYQEHPNPSLCPVKYNYDLLDKEAVKHKIVALLIEAIVKYKLIVSVRLLMNFVYDLIIPAEFSKLSDLEIQQQVINSQFVKEYHHYILPTLLFDSPDTSPIFKCIKRLDPVAFTNEALDHLIIQLGTTAQPLTYFLDSHLLSEQDTLANCLDALSVMERIKLFIRLNYLKEVEDQLLAKDVLYEEYMMNLYAYNAGLNHELYETYQHIAKAIYQWNGTTKLEGGYINLNLMRKQSSYKVSHKLELKFDPKDIPLCTGQLERFTRSLSFGFKVEGDEKDFKVKVDYGLYRLLRKINEGYRPNRIDKSNHIDFTKFVDRLSNHKAQEKSLQIQEYYGEKHKKFKLSYNSGFGMFQFEEVQ